ncbi:SDR family NAD(P)-dependent oxidoreductase [Geodermatophilus sp. CPCC 205761]|uniref:SDR family NAD(P)-dependent oxidoreductase n=1 Tax=Geodermatophilus sp. CPCC 205761 TaxID=2936597 RepID=UPI003EE830DA
MTDVVAPGRVAVVTGAASGIGLALSERFAAEGMRVVMADVEEPALAAAADALRQHGADVLPVVTDVADEASVEALRDAALTTYGAVHVLCNNAGVGGPHGPVWTASRGDLEWVMGVNVWGVLHGIRAFVPVLLEQDAGHVVNTASIFGLFAGTLGIYGPSKHTVVALSEALHFQLREAGAPVGVTVLCPSAVRTNIATSDRNRPATAGPSAGSGPAEQASVEHMAGLVDAGRPPAEVAGLVVDAIRSQRFYVLTDTRREPAILARARAIVDGSAPLPPLG